MKKFISFTLLMLCNSMLFAHEAWLMTPEQFREWSSKPRPTLFTEFNLINISLLVITLIGISGWYLLGKTRLANSCQKFQNYFSDHYDLGLFLIRVGMAITLIISVFALIPRHGFENALLPTLLVPDLILPPYLIWFKWVEFFIAICLLFGIFVRAMGFLLLVCLQVAFIEFGGVVTYYAGYIAGIGIYLLLMGGGKFSLLKVKHNDISHSKKIANFSLLILRLGAGLNFLYGGIYYKFLHPNIDIGMLSIHHTFTFGLGPELFTLLMAAVETALGVLLIMGVLIRPLAIVIFAFFIVIGILVNENVFAHSFIIGLLCVLFINGGGLYSKSGVRGQK